MLSFQLPLDCMSSSSERSCVNCWKMYRLLSGTRNESKPSQSRSWTCGICARIATRPFTHGRQSLSSSWSEIGYAIWRHCTFLPCLPNHCSTCAKERKTQTDTFSRTVSGLSLQGLQGQGLAHLEVVQRLIRVTTFKVNVLPPVHAGDVAPTFAHQRNRAEPAQSLPWLS